MNEQLLDDFGSKKVSGKAYSAIVIILLILFPVVLGIGTLMSFHEIGSIMTSGGVLAAIGVLLLIAGLIKRRLFVLLIGAFGLVLVLAITLLIWWLELGPSDVKKPLPFILSGILGLVLVAYLWFVLNEIRKKIKNHQKID